MLTINKVTSGYPVEVVGLVIMQDCVILHRYELTDSNGIADMLEAACKKYTDIKNNGEVI